MAPSNEPTLLAPEHLSLRAAVRQAFEVLEPERLADERALVRQLAALGCQRHLVPSAFGGVAGRVDVRALCVIREEMAYRNPAADSVFAVNGLGSHPLLLAGAQEPHRALLSGVAAGEVLFAFALTEPDAGSDV